MATKKDLREIYLQKRKALNPAARARADAIIRHRLFNDDRWKEAKMVLTYASLEAEVDTRKIIEKAKEQKKRVVVIPCTRAQAEPVLEAGVDPDAIDLVVAPGVAFDREGGRLGFGGGYFDKLLYQLPKAPCIALAYSQQIHDDPLPLEAHDISMHTIITEKEVLNIR